MYQPCLKPLVALLFAVFLSTAMQPQAYSLTDLRMSENGRYLIHEDGSPFFPIADTAWAIAWRTNRTEVDEYVQHRKAQHFNTIAMVAFPSYANGAVIPNAYGDFPLEANGATWDPQRPVTTPGKNPEDSAEYDYWDHLEYIVDTAKAAGMYVVLLPAWGGCVAGSYVQGAPNEQRVLNESNAYGYAQWIGERFSDKDNIIWMLGGDRSAVYGERDYRAVFRTMAEGIADGVNGINQQDAEADYSTTLMSYHPRKWHPNSSAWFHNDVWLDFNSIQDQPSDQISATAHDVALPPQKPTWLFEGGYEFRTRGEASYTDWQIRFQAYQTVFAGAFGTTYGSMNIFHFNMGVSNLDEPVTTKEDRAWEASLDEAGASDMRHLIALMTSMTNEQYFDRIPDQELLDGDTGGLSGSEGVLSTCLLATRSAKGDYAMIYSANGRNARVKMNLLSPSSVNAYWFNPREGTWRVADIDSAEAKPFQQGIPCGTDGTIVEFDPPGEPADGNDWVLVLKAD